MKITALAPFYGSNRMGARHVGELLTGCDWVGIAFAGGMSEVPQIKARTIVVNDVHRHVINLAAVVADPALKSRLIERLDATPFHPDMLARSQTCAMAFDCTDPAQRPDLDAAFDYFVCAWMARNGVAGTAGEFKAGFSMRWEAGGGDSAIRFRNATEGLADWHRVMQRCSFSTLDAFAFLANCRDKPSQGIFCDPPWPDDGYKYRHPFTEAQHTELAEVLAGYRRARVVVRLGDHPLVRRLYAESHWHWQPVAGRTATNRAKAEVLLIRRDATPNPDLYAEAAP